MEMLRHKNIPDDPETQFLTQFPKSAHPMVFETLGIVHAGTPIRTSGQKVQVVEAIVMVQLGHARIICLPGRLHRDKKRCDVGATREFKSGELKLTCKQVPEPTPLQARAYELIRAFPVTGN